MIKTIVKHILWVLYGLCVLIAVVGLISVFKIETVGLIPKLIFAWLICGLLGLPFYKKSPKTILPKKPIKMTGLDFEQYCADLLRKKGFKSVYVTPASGDYGADIIAFDRNNEKWVFQCKHYKGNVSNSAVQEVVSAKAHYNAKRAAVMTNSRMTEQARQLAFENAVELYEGLCD